MFAGSDHGALLLVEADAEQLGELGGGLQLTGAARSAWHRELCALGDFAVATRRMRPPIRRKDRDRWAKALHALLSAEQEAVWCEHGPPPLPPEFRGLALAWLAAPPARTRMPRSYPLRVTERLAELYRDGFGRWPSAQETGRGLRFMCAFHMRLAELPIVPRYVAPSLDAERYRLRQVLTQWRNGNADPSGSAHAPGAPPS